MCDLLDFVLDGGCDETLAAAGSQPAVSVSQRGMQEFEQQGSCIEPDSKYKGPSMQGKVGKGRFGDSKDRGMLTLHMRSQKFARHQHRKLHTVFKTLKGSTFRKGNKNFRVAAKETRHGGILLSLDKQGTKGNRFMRRIPFSKFLEASYTQNGTNVAVAARLEIDLSTVPRVQKTCSGVAMTAQAKLCWQLIKYCTEHKPLAVIRLLGTYNVG